MKTEIKIRLGVGELPGYISILDSQMSEYQTNQCTEIFVDRFLELIPVESTMSAIALWVTKMRHGAKLNITSTDIVQVAKVILTKQLKLPDVNKLLFGVQNRSCLSLDDTTSILEHLGLKILSKKINNDLTYSISAERP